MVLDNAFSYKSVTRFVLMHKYGLQSNPFCVPAFTKLYYYFPLSKLEDLDDVQVYNYMYLFKFFYGYRAFLTRYKSSFSLGVWTYSLRVSLFVSAGDVYNNLFFLLNDIIRKLDKLHLKFGVYSYKARIFYLSINDMNVFSERKTNMGLFSLSTNIKLNLFVSGADFISCRGLLKNIKYKFF